MRLRWAETPASQESPGIGIPEPELGHVGGVSLSSRVLGPEGPEGQM